MALRKTALAALAMVAALIASSAAVVLTSSASARSPRAGISAPDNPQYSLGVLEYLWPMCSGAHDYSAGCMEPSLAMLNAGRLSEQLGPVVLPSNWRQLTVAEQLFVLSELERTVRGLPADTGLAADWDSAAQAGAAFSANGFSAGAADRHESYTEIFGTDGRRDGDPLDFTWSSSEQQLLPTCEQAGDSCSWAGIKVATASGLESARRGSSQSSQVEAEPSLAVQLSSRVSRSGHVSMLIRTGVRLLGVGVVARVAGHHVALRVRRRSKFVFRATGTLTPGRWTVTIRYRRTRGRWARSVSKRRLTVPVRP